MIKTRNLKLNVKGDLQYITFPKLEALGIVKHAFSTRHGGVSTGDCAKMNLSFNRSDDFETVLKNYRILCGEIGIDVKDLVLSHQTHTNNVMVVNETHRGTGVFKPSFSDIDGLITNSPHVALVTQYADCTPLLFCDPVKKVIATSHAGWRGTAKEIGRVTVEKMVAEFDSDPKDIVAAIGPCILDCCYEVDEPVYSEFSKLSYLDLERIFTPKGNGHYQLNLVEANRQILVNAGLDPNNIDLNDICTCCFSDDLHSHRKTVGKRGNLAAIIALNV